MDLTAPRGGWTGHTVPTQVLDTVHTGHTDSTYRQYIHAVPRTYGTIFVVANLRHDPARRREKKTPQPTSRSTRHEHDPRRPDAHEPEQ
jgi:hypothetical protein